LRLPYGEEIPPAVGAGIYVKRMNNACQKDQSRKIIQKYDGMERSESVEAAHLNFG
jgi:hypothetical protein